MSGGEWREWRCFRSSYRWLELPATLLLLLPPPHSLSPPQYDSTNQSWRKLQMLVMQLRKCCNHPYLFPGGEPDFDGHTTGAPPPPPG